MSENTVCPVCGGYKKPWFALCWECNEDEKQKPRCEVCDVEVPEGHTLCKVHWLEKKKQKEELRKVDFVKQKKEKSYKDTFEGKYYYNSQKMKSKSELLICYFLVANRVHFAYEPSMTPNGKELRPDFVLEDEEGNCIILEHFGLSDVDYVNKKKAKIKDYELFCRNNGKFFFIYTDEEDMFDLKERLGRKLNTTPLKRALWK